VVHKESDDGEVICEKSGDDDVIREESDHSDDGEVIKT
jgi:hypothetical protein